MNIDEKTMAASEQEMRKVFGVRLDLLGPKGECGIGRIHFSRHSERNNSILGTRFGNSVEIEIMHFECRGINKSL